MRRSTGLLIRHGIDLGTTEMRRMKTSSPQITANTKAFMEYMRFPGPNLKGSFSATSTHGQFAARHQATNSSA